MDYPRLSAFLLFMVVSLINPTLGGSETQEDSLGEELARVSSEVKRLAEESSYLRKGMEENFRLVMDELKNCKSPAVEEPHTGNNESDSSLPKGHINDCSAATVSGVYTIVKSGFHLNAYCQVDRKGKWTVIQRRAEGNVNFTRDWVTYSQGFGKLTGDHWLGNGNIHSLTLSGLTKLRIDLEDWRNTRHTIYYNQFRVAGAEALYKLTLSGFHGSQPVGDSLAYHNGMKFSTYDKDNDGYGNNCAKLHRGGWWYKACHYSNLNGLFNSTVSKGIIWKTWRGYAYSIKSTMMISDPKKN